MSEPTALVYEQKPALAEKVRKAVKQADYRVKTTSDEARFWDAYFREGADVVVVDFSASRKKAECQVMLDRLRSSDPSVGVVLLAVSYAAARRCLADKELRNPFIEVVTKPLRAGELALRVERLRLFKESLMASRDEEPAAAPVRKQAVHVVPRLHDAASGRIDAKKVARFFGLSLAELGRLVGKTRAALHKTPDAASVQEKLKLFASIASALLRLVGSAEAARIWLNAPNPELEGATPAGLVRDGNARTVEELLSDALVGQPT